MAEERSEPVYGGYDYEFVDNVSNRFICQICTKALRDPHLAVCCGQHFCESCLNRWFTRQCKQSCPHCRAEGEAFNHVIHKGLRSEVSQLNIRCSNHGEGCQWTGELGALKKHLESDDGCGFVVVECPNKCFTLKGKVKAMKRIEVHEHLTQVCYLRLYQCEFCGLKDTYRAIIGDGHLKYVRLTDDHYFGHQAKCPEAPLTCPNKCGSTQIKRKDMENHRSQCPQEPVECPFAEAGCKANIHRHQLDDHMTTNLKQHVMLLMVDRKQLKKDFNVVKDKLSKAESKPEETELKLNKAESKLEETELKLSKAESKLEETGLELSEAESKLEETELKLSKTETELKCKLSIAETEIDETKRRLFEVGAHLDSIHGLGVDFRYTANKFEKKGDSLKLTMRSFSKYRHSGRVWHSPPFYYGEGYKMCLEVWANGMEEGAGRHISVALLHVKGECDKQLKYPAKFCTGTHDPIASSTDFEGHCRFLVCHSLKYPPQLRESLRSMAYYQYVIIGNRYNKFCNLKNLHLVNDCLTFNFEFNGCYLYVGI